jgi:hypothetical protein
MIKAEKLKKKKREELKKNYMKTKLKNQNF